MASPALDAVLSLAADEALALGHGYVGPEHLLIACSRISSPQHIAVLARHGLDPRTLRVAIGAIVGRERRAPKPYIPPPRSSRALRALALAGDRATTRHAPEPTPDDLLPALLEDVVATGGVVGAALAHQRVALTTLRENIRAVDDRDRAI